MVAFCFLLLPLRLCLVSVILRSTFAFLGTPPFKSRLRHRDATILFLSEDSRSEAERLLEKAQKLRKEIYQVEQSKIALGDGSTPTAAVNAKSNQRIPIHSKWTLPEDSDASSPSYRLYFDIGREDGTWMEPKWGASGKRLQFTLDVRFLGQAAPPESAQAMVQDNRGNLRSAVYCLETASLARLRNGFEQMPCGMGAYRIDGASQQQTVRFFLQTTGKKEGDVEIPPGPLYVSLPIFLGRLSQLSRKEGIVSIRQMGWNTGWYRDESRMVGVVRAVPLNEAQQKDGF